MKRALVASATIHGLLGAALLATEPRAGDGAAAHERASTIDVVDVIAVSRETPPSEDVQGGGASASVASRVAPSPAPRGGRGRARAVSPSRDGELAINHAVTIDCPDGSARDHALRGCGRGGIDRDGDGGDGIGAGGDRGAGIGLGDGERIALAEELVLPDPPRADVPPPSKARPAKLIYPKKTRDLGQDRLFVARITVDRDGYVVGARLVKGVSAPRDAEATDLIFRFRYLPALDRDGHAIPSTFEQPFHVNR